MNKKIAEELANAVITVKKPMPESCAGTEFRNAIRAINSPIPMPHKVPARNRLCCGFTN